MKKTLKFLLSLTAFAMVAGSGVALATGLNSNSIKQADAGTSSVAGTYLYVNDEGGKGWSYNGGDPVAHLYSITFDSNSIFSKISDVTDSKFTKGTDYLEIGMNWVSGQSNRPYEVTIPWYITKFTVCYRVGTRYLYEKGNSSSYSITCNRGDQKKLYTGNYDGYGSWFDGDKYRTAVSLVSETGCTYSETTYKLTYNTNGGSDISYSTLKKYQKTVKPTDPTKTGHTFSKWTKTNSSSGTEFTFGSNITADTTIYAQWAAQTYNLSYKDVGGGDYSGDNSSSLTTTHTYGSTTNLVDGTKTGFDFVGWHLSPNGIDSAFKKLEGTDITSDSTLYAEWNITHYNITFDQEGGTGGSLSGNYYTISSSDQTITITDPVKDGYTPSYSITKSEGAGTPTVSGNIVNIPANTYGEFTINTTWTLKKYTISYNPGTYATGDTYNQTKNHNTDARLRGLTYSRTGYNQTGWASDAAGTTYAYALSGTYSANASITLYPYWTKASKPTHTVTFVPNDSTWGSVDPTELAIEEDTTFVKSGNVLTIGTNPVTEVTATANVDPSAPYTYSFSSWSGVPTTMGTENITITAVFVATPKSYNLKWDDNNATRRSGGSGEGTYQYNATITAPSVSRIGYQFDCWLDQNGNEFTGKMPGYSVTYTAQWTPESYTVNLNKVGGTGGDDSVTATYDAAMPTITIPSKSGYSFGGYFEEQNGGGTKYYNSDGTSANVWKINYTTTLYAYWTIETYTVTFNANGGSTPSPATKTVTYGSPYGTLATTTNAAYIFKGWNTASDGSGSTITPETIVTATQSHTLYAQWKLPEYYVQIDGQSKVALTDKSDAQGVIYQVTSVSNLTLNKGDSIKVFIGDDEIMTNVEAEADIGDSKNNVVTRQSGGWEVHNNARSKLYLKPYLNNNNVLCYKFWVGGYVDISPNPYGVKSGTTFYIKDSMNRSDFHWRDAGAKIAVYFYAPIDDDVTMKSWTGWAEPVDSTTDTMVWSVVVPENGGKQVTWSCAIAVRNSNTASFPTMEGANFWNQAEPNPKPLSAGYQNGIEVTSGDKYASANYFMYSDGGIKSGDGIYFNDANTWNTDHYYAYFFGTTTKGNVNAWSAQMTEIPGKENWFECNIPQYQGEDVEWTGLIIVNNTSASFPGLNYEQTVNIFYSASIRNNRTITLKGQKTSEDYQEVLCAHDFIDEQRAELFGTNFLTNCQCTGAGSTKFEPSAWNTTAKNEYKAMSLTAQGLFWSATGDEFGTDLEKAAFRYDYILNKYGTSVYENFANRSSGSNKSGMYGFNGIFTDFTDGSSSNPTLIIVISSVITGLAIGGYFLLRRKKED